MSEQSLKDKTVKGVVWSAVERFSTQGVQFFVMLVIARILDPKDFGLVGMLAVFLAVSQSLVDSGFSQALVRKQNRTELDNNTVFYFNIVVSFVIYIFLYGIAPIVADFYDEPILIDLMRVVCVVVIINSFAVVQRALYEANINFKTQAKATFSATVISGILGVYMAIKGYGVWALAWQQIFRALANTILLWWNSYWRPKMVYSWCSFRELFSFGSKLMISGLIDTIYNNVYQIVIGKIFSADSLGHFTQAKQIAALPSSNVNSIIGSVTYPVLSSIQDNDERLGYNYRKLLRVSAFIIFPMMCGLAAISDPLIYILLGEKWNFAATLIIPICFSMMWYPVHAINLNLLKVKGRSDLFLKLEIIKKILGVAMLIFTIPMGIVVMCYGRIINSLISLAINTYYTGKLINVGFSKQMKDLSGSLILSFSMFAVVLLVTHYIENNLYKLVSGIITGLIYFMIVSLFAKVKEIEYLKSLIKK